MTKNTLLVVLLLLSFPEVWAQDAWKLKTNKEGIQVYTSTVKDSKINIVKVTCVFSATLSQLVAVILDLKSANQWQYKTENHALIKQVSPSELYYYAESSFPWPAENRDYVSHIKVTQNPITKTVSINAVNVPDMVPLKSNRVRIVSSVGKWTITPINKNQISIEYILQVDPGGSLPSAIINTFITAGPFETFKRLKTQVSLSTYSTTTFPFILN